MKRRRAFVVLALGCCGCGGATGSPEPECDAAPSEQVGTWAQMPLPEGVFVPSDPVASDGIELVVMGLGCTDCQYSVLDADGGAWVASSPVPLGKFASGGAIIASENYYYLRLYSPEEGPFAALHDRAGDSWSSVLVPDDVSYGETALWTGSDFLFWGGTRYPEEDDGVLEPDTLAVRFYDGALFDPMTGAWRSIPAAREEASYRWGEGGPSLASVWTSAGLFVWGTNPERTETWGALLDADSVEWTPLDTGPGTPPLRQNHRLVTVGDEVFLFGGVTPGATQVWRTVWRYTLSTGTWNEVEGVPAWADPLLGTVVDGNIAFLGRCAGGDLYDPSADTWRPLSIEGSPPSAGVPRGAGSFLTVTDTYEGEQETNAVWMLDLGS